MMFLIDSHCHIDRLNYNLLHKSVEDVLKKSFNKDVKKFLTVSTSIENFYKIKKLCQNHIAILYSCGVHPLNCNKELIQFYTINNIFKKIAELSLKKHVIAIGETGLDYHYSSEYKNIQKIFFRQHIRTAIKMKKPIIVHSRNAINDTIKILREENAEQCRGILHSFTENYDSAYKLLDIGFYISFSGIVTFKNSTKLHSVIKKIPLSRLLIETDSPYLSPVPYRGQENQPAYLLEIAKKISIIKKTNIEKISEITKNNFYTLFDL